MGWSRWAQEKVRANDLPSRASRMTSKNLLVLRRDNGSGVFARRFRHCAEARRATAIHTESDRMVVVASNYRRRARSNEINRRSWVRTVVNQIAEHPQLVVVVRQSRKSFHVRVQLPA